ncbi:MAG: NADH-quinone oxidoreductase subunit NuoN, partial [Gaiellales bacterium]
KLYVFSAAVDNGQTYLAVAGVLATLVGLGYYLKVPFALYDRDVSVPDPARSRGIELTGFAVALSAVAVILLGVVPAPVIDLARTASSSLFG